MSVSPEAIELIKSMMSTDPESRPSAQEALCHPWLIGTKNELTIRSFLSLSSLASTTDTSTVISIPDLSPDLDHEEKP